MSKVKVFVGLSGGVDSSVAALLLKQAGYEVWGVFIKGWQPDWIPCTWQEDRISALRTAAHLDIPFLTLDLENNYKKKIIDYLLQKYKSGHTPNPDMLCNREIKFGDFLKWSKSLGAQYVATGHYAIIENNGLYEAKDKEKDQSYFLSQLTQKEISQILFPVGKLLKSEVRKIASEANLPVATRKDSQGICFVGNLEMKDFLKRELTPPKGKVLNKRGEEIGEHDGAILYTIGERHGFKIFKNIGDKDIGKYYVVNKDIKNNFLYVEEGAEILKNIVNKNGLKIINLSLVKDNSSLFVTKNLSVRWRYRGSKIPVKIDKMDWNEKTAEFIFLEDSLPQDIERGLYASGQFAVIYSGTEVCGGGEIV